MRRCSLFQPYPLCLSSLLDLRILWVRFSQSYPPNAPLSSAHRSRILQVCFSLPSPRLLRVHFSPPSPLLSCATIQWWWKNNEIPLSGPLCEAHIAFPSSLAVYKPMLYRVEGVLSVTALAFVPVIRRAVGGQCISDRVARRLWLAEIMRNAPRPPASAASIVPLRAAVRRDVSVELEMGLVTLDGLVAMAGPWAMTTVAAVVMVMAVAVVGVSKELDSLHVYSPSSCGHRGQPVPLVSPALHAQAQVYHGYWYLQHHSPGRYANRDSSGGDAERCSNGIG